MPGSRHHQRSNVGCDSILRLLAQVVLLGKPAPAIYKVAMEMLGVQDPKEVLAIGDSLEHDIAGEPDHSIFALLQAMMLAELRRTCWIIGWCQQVPMQFASVLWRAKQLWEMLSCTLCRCSSSRLRLSLHCGRHPC